MGGVEKQTRADVIYTRCIASGYAMEVGCVQNQTDVANSEVTKLRWYNISKDEVQPRFKPRIRCAR